MVSFVHGRLIEIGFFFFFSLLFSLHFLFWSKRRLMRPLVLRRLKRQVATSIPAMKETVIDVELTTLQKQYYRAIFEKNREFLYRGCAGHVPQLVNVEMELRKCCQHPFLLTGVEESEADRIRDAIMAGESLGTLDELMLEEAEKVKNFCFPRFCGCL